MCVVILLAACGQRAPTWQEQYDLGVRYLGEGSYEEAIIAFTATIISRFEPARGEPVFDTDEAHQFSYHVENGKLVSSEWSSGWEDHIRFCELHDNCGMAI